MSKISLIVGLIAGIPILVDSFVDIAFVSTLAQEFQRWAVILAAFSTGLGVLNLTIVQVSTLKRKKHADGSSIIESLGLLLMLWFMIFVGIFKGQSHSSYDFLFKYVLQTLSASGFAMLAFFIASAAYRAFRLRNIDSALLLISGAIVMIANVPFVQSIWPASADISSWIVEVVNGAAMKGIVIGASLGAIATSLKVLVGLDRSHFRG